MFERNAQYPTAVASSDDKGVAAAIRWCGGYLENGDTFTVWTPTKGNLGNNDRLSALVARDPRVEHITGRGFGMVASPGPVLMAWADMDDIGKLVRFGARDIRALCVISWVEERLAPWVATMKPEILGDGSAWANAKDPADTLDPVVIEGLKSMTRKINHNNTIKAGYEKEDVVGTLMTLKNGGYRLDAAAMEAWALAHGWAGENPKHLAQYVRDINAGKRPRYTKNRFRSDYLDILRRRAEEGDDEDED